MQLKYYASCVRARLGAVIITAIFANSAVQAQTHSSMPLTLESAIKRTLLHTPALHHFTFKQQAIDAELKTAALKPAFSAGVEVENVLGTGEVAGIKGADITLSLSSVIELNDKQDARTQFTSAKRTVVEQQKQIVSLEMLAAVTRRYIDVLAQQEILKAQTEAESLARYAYQAVTKRVNAGASPAFEQHRANAALAKARLAVLTSKQNKQAMIKSLAIMWGQQSPVFNEVQGDLFALQASSPLTTLYQNVLNSPNIQIYAQQARLQQAKTRLTAADNSSDINWTAGIKRLNGIDEMAFVASASMPLFTQERNLGEYQKQQAIQQQITLEQDTAKLNLYHHLNLMLLARNNALLEVDMLKNAVIPPLQAALSQVEQAYLNGKFSYLEWVTTHQELLDAKLALIQSAKEAHQRGADIESLTAQPISHSQARAARHSAVTLAFEPSSNLISRVSK